MNRLKRVSGMLLETIAVAYILAWLLLPLTAYSAVELGQMLAVSLAIVVLLTLVPACRSK